MASMTKLLHQRNITHVTGYKVVLRGWHSTQSIPRFGLRWRCTLYGTHQDSPSSLLTTCLVRIRLGADCAYRNLVSPGRLISLDFQGQVIDDVDLTPLEDVAFETNGGHKVSGWGDQVCDANGNVFAVGKCNAFFHIFWNMTQPNTAVWGNVIARWDAVTKKASLYYAEPNPLIVPFSGYTGIENYKDQLLILYNVEYGRIEVCHLLIYSRVLYR